MPGPSTNISTRFVLRDDDGDARCRHAGRLGLRTCTCGRVCPIAPPLFPFPSFPFSPLAVVVRDKSYMFQCTISNDSPGKVARPATARGAQRSSAADDGAPQGSSTAAASAGGGGGAGSAGAGAEGAAPASDADDAAAAAAAMPGGDSVDAQQEAEIAGMFGTLDQTELSRVRRYPFVYGGGTTAFAIPPSLPPQWWFRSALARDVARLDMTLNH